MSSRPLMVSDSLKPRISWRVKLLENILSQHRQDSMLYGLSHHQICELNYCSIGNFIYIWYSSSCVDYFQMNNFAQRTCISNKVSKCLNHSKVMTFNKRTFHFQEEILYVTNLDTDWHKLALCLCGAKGLVHMMGSLGS